MQHVALAQTQETISALGEKQLQVPVSVNVFTQSMNKICVGSQHGECG